MNESNLLDKRTLKKLLKILVNNLFIFGPRVTADGKRKHIGLSAGLQG